jgi:biopolymer transport protein ExbB/TolQ
MADGEGRMEEWSDMKPKTGPISLIVIGSLLALGPVWGVLGTVIGMIHAFRTLAQSSVATPGQLASDLSVSLWATAAGFIILPIGLAFLISGIIWLTRTRKPASCP